MYAGVRFSIVNVEIFMWKLHYLNVGNYEDVQFHRLV